MQSELSTDQLGQSADSAAVKKPVQYAQPSRKLMEKFANISGFCRAAKNLIIAPQRAKRAVGHTKPLQACEYHIRMQKYPLRVQGPPV